MAILKLNYKTLSYTFADIFALEYLGTDKTWLEIGAYKPEGGSNTALLELNGWTGHSFEIDPKFSSIWADSWRDSTKSILHIDNALTYDYTKLEQKHFHFVQLDIDPAMHTFQVWNNLFVRDKITSDFVTFEHDIYRDWITNTKFKNDVYYFMTKEGYKRVFEDVPPIDTELEKPCEDWYISSSVLNPPLDMTFGDWARSMNEKYNMKREVLRF